MVFFFLKTIFVIIRKSWRRVFVSLKKVFPFWFFKRGFQAFKKFLLHFTKCVVCLFPAVLTLCTIPTPGGQPLVAQLKITPRVKQTGPGQLQSRLSLSQCLDLWWYSSSIMHGHDLAATYPIPVFEKVAIVGLTICLQFGMFVLPFVFMAIASCIFFNNAAVPIDYFDKRRLYNHLTI